jgi:tetratricopeptide (TPR) repeat protein
MSARWETVSVFISSTFRDMHAERDHLIRKVFPELRRRCEQYRLYFEDIDLRWGVTQEQAENNLVVELCLQQVEASRPYFLGLLGGRYGWRPEAFEPDTSEKFPWIKDYAGRSVTELEIIWGYEITDPKPRALFFERDPMVYDQIPDPSRPIYRDASDVDQRQLQELKYRLRAKGATIHRYECAWDRNAKDPGNQQRGRFVKLEDFGRVVLDQLWQAIKEQKELPDVPPDFGKENPFDVETAEHDHFREVRQRIFLGRRKERGKLQSFIDSQSRHVCVVTGPAGQGKSALLARFITDIEPTLDPQTKLLYHFVGASGTSTDLRQSVKRWVHEIATWIGVPIPTSDALPDLIPTFRGLLASVPEDRRLILIVDAIDQFGNESQAEDLIWLPEEPSANVRLIVSCPSDLAEPRARIQRGLLDRANTRIDLSPLDLKDRQDIVKEVPSVAAKTLDKSQVDKLLANPASSNPLYLRGALEEMRGFTPFERLGEFIARLPQGDPQTALRELFSQAYERLERDFGGRILVERVLGSIACAVRGLSEEELSALVADLPTRDDLQPLLRHLRFYLVRRGELYAFFHRALAEAAQMRYFHWLPRDPATELKESAHLRLARHFEEIPLSVRVLEELPWHLLAARDYDTLAEKLTEGPFFQAAWDQDEFAVRRWWSLMQDATSGRITVDKTYRPIVEYPHRAAQFPLWPLGILLQTTGSLQLAQQLWARFAEVARSRDDKAGQQASLGNQALILLDWGWLEEAMTLLKEVVRLCKELDDIAGLKRSLNNQALILKAWGWLEEAMTFLKEVERISRELGDEASLQLTLGNQALILRAWGRLEEAMILHQEEERLCKELANKAGLFVSLGNQALVLKDWGRLEEAMILQKEAERLCRELADKAGLSRILGDQALLLTDSGRLQEAMSLLKEKERLCKEMGDKVELSTSLGQQAIILQASDRLEEAMSLEKEAERLCRELADKARLSQSLGNQAIILRRWGRLEEAISLLTEVGRLCKELKDPASLAITLVNQGLIHRQMGNEAIGNERIREAYRIAADHKLLALMQKMKNDFPYLLAEGESTHA